MEDARATYLLATLKRRGRTWPKLWWRPDEDGAVCSFLGTVDQTFDAHATLTALEAKKERERAQTISADLMPRVRGSFAAHEARIVRKLSKEDVEDELILLAEVNNVAERGQFPGAGPEALRESPKRYFKFRVALDGKLVVVRCTPRTVWRF